MWLKLLLNIQILIHTSVKLVTPRHLPRLPRGDDFNPHEREARDWLRCILWRRRDYFNPHEREARDVTMSPGSSSPKILIHTSVKLVTPLTLLISKSRVF